MNCNSCGTELTMNSISADLHRRRDDYPQYDNAMIIDVKGGYGMFFDPLADFNPTRYRSVICSKCANKIMDTFPWLVE